MTDLQLSFKPCVFDGCLRMITFSFTLNGRTLENNNNTNPCSDGVGLGFGSSPTVASPHWSEIILVLCCCYFPIHSCEKKDHLMNFTVLPLNLGPVL